MTSEEMLVILNDVDGWFGWDIEDDLLTVDYWPSADGRRGPRRTAMWRLVPVEETR